MKTNKVDGVIRSHEPLYIIIIFFLEEELKRLHAAGYGQVGFNYDAPAESTPEAQVAEVEEPFEPTPAFKALLPIHTVFVSPQINIINYYY